MVVASFIKLIIIVLFAVLLIAGIVCLIGLLKNKKEEEPSILDVNVVGVPSTSDAKDFSYGYEKEETVVMQPVIENSEPVVEQPAQTQTEQSSQEVVEPQVEQSTIENTEENKGDE